ncbi:isocitrate lyase/phosphoenolpyruvate mutase family protein [Nocardioides sp. cx-173]|uniref:isocitrate lyase/PEP mutase family protein n=1 Tax=Nocardioides sp. cx-173 TaxID=2898796 RepID=UPI001E640FF4|nr:isocitrate lyase/phosphoenolpyruvate mutase family protein [Nocardioides sp. cx-173]MCD4525789.1 isocitrate lyase/phosphoenolpyruvate mutase family protein [Nocardioides sp. cx-173]UGB39946.1 isocitrate lyase/phosphoenolpyruvate mutase family protein [Nocardioides sp. cx-173]
MTDLQHRASELLRLHQDPSLLTVVNVWDVITAKVVSAVEGTTALATASHSIAASRGYEDGENIPVDEMIAEVARIVAATSLPVSADLEGGYGDAPETIRKAIGVGVVGANLEDQMKPLSEAAAQVEAVMRAAAAEGVADFVLNARTDAFLKAGDRDPADVLADAIARGRAFLDAGAPVVFVPGRLNEEQVVALVDALGPQRLTLIGIPGIPPLSRLEELGVARVSYGPMPQNVALTALAKLVEDVHAGGGVPADMRILN